CSRRRLRKRRLDEGSSRRCKPIPEHGAKVATVPAFVGLELCSIRLPLGAGVHQLCEVNRHYGTPCSYSVQRGWLICVLDRRVVLQRCQRKLRLLLSLREPIAEFRKPVVERTHLGLRHISFLCHH